MSPGALPLVVFVAALVGTVSGHLLFYVFVWLRMARDETEREP